MARLSGMRSADRSLPGRKRALPPGSGCCQIGLVLLRPAHGEMDRLAFSHDRIPPFQCASVFSMHRGLALLGYYTIVCATNGAQGLEMFFAVRPDCLIIDVKMPCLDGYQLVRPSGETRSRLRPHHFAHGAGPGSPAVCRSGPGARPIPDQAGHPS